MRSLWRTVWGMNKRMLDLIGAGGVVLAVWGAGLAGAASPTPTPAPVVFENTLAQRVLACTGCHGAQGRAAPDGYHPRIAGKPAGYLYHQLLNFKEGRRVYRPMVHMVQPLSDGYLLAMAQHFGALDVPYPPPVPITTTPEGMRRGEQLALQGDPSRQLPACTACHGERLTGVQPAVPGLLGLPRDYLNAQMGAWRIGTRQAHAPDCMGHIAQRLDASDLSAVSGWLASRPLPANPHPAPASSVALPMKCGGVWTSDAPKTGGVQ